MMVVTLAFGFSANAQQKTTKPAAAKAKATVEASADTPALKAAKLDLAELKKVVTFKDSRDADMYLQLFERKHRFAVEEPNLSADRKASISQSIEAKLKAGLTPDQIQKIEATPGLMAKLTTVK